MIFSCPDAQQDTVKVNTIVQKDSIALKTDSLPVARILSSKVSVKHVVTPVPKTISVVLTDTTAVCRRNSIIDVTFYDPTNVITTIKPGAGNRFLFIITEESRVKQAEAKAILVKHLKPGKDIPVQPHQADWVILIILISAFLYSLIRTTSKSILPGVSRLFQFRGINDSASRGTDGLFHWQSTILNLVSFLIISLFIYCIAVFYDFIPSGISGITFWLISFGIIIVAITLRHITCVITGSLSGQRDVFRDYLVGIYKSYQFSALILSIIVILLSYTILLPVKVLIISGIIALGIMYLIRVIRLLKIFINRNISIFYLILYLCALEILPVVISIKYFTGLA